MATADELLALSTESDKTLVINSDLRTIAIPSSVKNLGVESDKDVQKLRFVMPRYYNDIDLSTFSIRINYENAKGGEDVGNVSDILIEDETITFTWVVGSFALMYAGEVEFVVCLREIDDDGVITREFNTTTATMNVLKGKETDQGVIEINYDLIAVAADEAIKRAQSTDLKGEPGYTPVKGEDYYTPEEQEAFTQMVVDNANGQFASAIKGKASGEIIRVDDVCPIEHTVKGWVHGKNIFKPEVIDKPSVGDYNARWQCTAAIDTDGKITLTNTEIGGTAYARVGTITLKRGKTYVLSQTNQYNVSTVLAWYTDTVIPAWNTATKITPVSDITVDIAVYMSDISVVGNTACVYIQIEENEVTEYEPHVDPASVTLTRCGKNLFVVTPETNNGVTLSRYGDYYILNGTATKSYNFTTRNGIHLPSGVYTISANNPKHNGLGVSIVQVISFATKSSVATTDDKENSKATGTIIAGDDYECRIRIEKGVTYNNYIIKPQLEFGNTDTEYEPYLECVNYTPSADGTVDIVSVSPTMTLLTDTPGVIVEAEYSRDTTKMFETYVVTDETWAQLKSDVVAEVEDELVDILNELHTYAQSKIGGES